MAEERTAAQIEQMIEDLRRRWPAHTVPPAMVARLEELEDELAEAHDREAGARA